MKVNPSVHVHNASGISADEDGGGVATGEPGDPSSSTKATLPMIFGGLGRIERAQRPHLPESTAPKNQHLRIGMQSILTDHDLRKLIVPLKDGPISISVPIVRLHPQGNILAKASQQPPTVTQEKRLDDGSLLLAYQIRPEGETSPWLVAMHVDRDGKILRAQVIQNNAPGPRIELAQLRFDGGSKFEALPPELTKLIALAAESSSDLDALALTNSAMTRQFGTHAELAARFESLVDEVVDINKLNRAVVNIARDVRLCDLHRSEQADVNDGISGTRLTGIEKGHLLEMLAKRVPSLVEISGDGVMTPQEERILARLIVLSENDKLSTKDRGNLTAIESGRLFGNLRAAISGGVAVPVAVATFADGDVDDPELQALAIPAANVLIMTGSTWFDAAKLTGIAEGHAQCDALRLKAITTVVFNATRSMNSIEDVLGLADAHRIDELKYRVTIGENWTRWRHSPDTLAVLNGERPGDVLSSIVGAQSASNLTELECMLVIMKAPGQRRLGFSPEQTISSLGITHPISCHMARRIHSESLQPGLLSAPQEVFPQ